MDLKEFLLWLANSGGGSMVVSYILEQIGWYQTLESKVKQMVFFGAATLVTVLGYVGIVYIPESVITEVSPYFAILYTTFISIFLGTEFHKKTKI